MATQGSTLNTAFWLHLLLLVAGWTGPFLFPWYIMVIGYALIFFQFLIFGKCLVNEMHELENENYYTFYTFLFECLGMSFSKKTQKIMFYFIRWPLYPLLSAFTLFWQLYLGFKPLLF
ncbi:MAG: hypothetical protein ACI97N_000702 [Cognaticolwellia sp.]|jgi:hypothetical protein